MSIDYLKTAVQTQELVDGEIAKLIEKLDIFDTKKATLKEKSEFYRFSILPFLDLADAGTQGLLIDKINNTLGIPKRAVLKDLKSKISQDGKVVEATPIALFDGLIDIVDHEGQPAFLILENEGLRVATQIEQDGVVYVPPDKKKMPWLLPRAEEVLEYYKNDSDAILFDDLLTYHKRISELPDEGYYDLITAWDFHSYLVHKFEYSPYIWFYAIVERGKSRTGKGMVYAAYRGMCVESLRDAYLIRVTNNLSVTLFIDAINLWKKAEVNGTEDVILQRYEKGATVPRVLHPDRGPFKDTTYFKIFGSTVIATNEPVHDALDTRAIQINMPAAKRQSFEEDVKPEDGLPFRERLVAFRGRHLNEELPQVKKPANGRLGDILKPLYQIIKLIKPEKERDFLELVQKVEEGRKADKADSSEGRIVQALLSLEDKLEGGLLSVSDVTEEFNRELPDRWHWTNKKIGRKLKAMGFKGVRHGSRRYVEYDFTLILNLSTQYGITSQTSLIAECNIDKGISGDIIDDISDVTSQTSPETSPRKGNNDGQTGISDISDVSSEGVQERKKHKEDDQEILTIPF